MILRKAFNKKLDAKAWLVISDVHAPYHDTNAFDAVCSFAKDFDFDGCVINGDFMDFFPISSHNKGSLALLQGKSMKKEYDAGRKLLKQLRSAIDGDIHYIDGNHENRLDRWLALADNAVWKDELTLENGLRFEEFGIKHAGKYPDAFVRLGHLYVTHGTAGGDTPAKKHLMDYKVNILTGHLHTPQIYYGATFGHPIASFVSGHLMDETSDAAKYMKAVNRWCKGFSIVYVRPNGEFNVQLIQFWNGVFFYGGRQYGVSS